MIRILAILEDTIIDAEYDENGFKVTFADAVTGKTEVKTLTTVEFGVTMALAVGIVEEDPSFVNLYEHVEHIAFSQECRPYP